MFSPFFFFLFQLQVRWLTVFFEIDFVCFLSLQALNLKLVKETSFIVRIIAT